MSQINVGGVIKGGLVAGVLMNISEIILNIPVTGERATAELAAHNLAFPGTNVIALFTFTTLLLGFLTVYLYAAIRPRFGPGPATAIRAGILVWLFAYLYPSIFFGGLGVNSWGLVAIGDVWTYFECIIAAVAGAYFYSER